MIKIGRKILNEKERISEMKLTNLFLLEQFYFWQVSDIKKEEVENMISDWLKQRKLRFMNYT